MQDRDLHRIVGLILRDGMSKECLYVSSVVSIVFFFFGGILAKRLSTSNEDIVPLLGRLPLPFAEEPKFLVFLMEAITTH